MFSELFDNTTKGTHVWPIRTICEMHRELYDDMVLLLAEEHQQAFLKLLPKLEECYLTGIKLAKALIKNKIERPDCKNTDIDKNYKERLNRVHLIKELERQDKILKDFEN